MPEAVQKYRLCETCLRRQGGKSGHLEVADEDECFICRGLVGRVDELVRNVATQARPYEFRTFAVGLSLPEGVQEREDELRSIVKLKGRETIKLQLSATIANEVSKKLRKKIEKFVPDLTAIVDLSNFQVKIILQTSVLLRQVHEVRGISQRREWCPECRGKGAKCVRITGFAPRGRAWKVW